MQQQTAGHSTPVRRRTSLDVKMVKYLFRTSQDILLVIDYGISVNNGILVDANDVACAKLGYTREELLSLPPTALFAPETAALLPQFRAKLLSKRAILEEIVLIAKNGQKIHTELNAHLLLHDGRLLAFGIARDITNRLRLETSWQHMLHSLEDQIAERNAALMDINRQLQAEILERAGAEQALAEKEQQLRLITDNMLDIVMQIDLAGTIKYISPSCQTMLGYQSSFFLGKSIFEQIHPDDITATSTDFQQTVTTGAPVAAQFRVRHADGHWVWAEGVAKSVIDDRGNILGAVACCRDITSRKRVEQQLKYQAVRDPVTGLYNRTYFEIQMTRLVDPALQPVGLIMCDLDGLKYVNDTIGHDAGDHLLADLATLIGDTFTGNEIVARIGGDEFAVILPNTDEAALSASRLRFKDAIDTYNNSGPKIPLCVSIGTAITGPSLSIYGLFKAADNSMYREKLHSQNSSRSSVVQALKKALEARDFVTEGHAARLRDLTIQLARSCGFPDYKLTDLILFAEFHDIGKVGIPDYILFKPGPLTPEEVMVMRSHSEIGHRIAISTPDLEPIADWILMHHEWWNGKGYPLGLSGAAIPLECRILSIVDAYDAMTNDRPYRKATTHAAAIAEIERCSGIQFDPDLVKRFTRLLSSS